MAADSSAYRSWYLPFLILAGSILCIYGLRSLGASYAVTRWPVVPARVVYSAIDSTGRGGFRPRISYEFYLAGRRYLASGVDRPAGANEASTGAMPLERARAAVARYPVGLELLAGYDPGNLGRAVLRPRFNWWTITPVLLGVLFAAIGIMIWRQGRRASETTAGL